MSLVAAWNFDNDLEGLTVYDDMGTHSGTTVGSVPIVNGPISVKGRDFPGTAGNRIEVLHNPALSGAGGISVGAWVNFDAVTGTSTILIIKEDSPARGWNLSLDPAGPLNFRFLLRDGPDDGNTIHAISDIQPVVGRLYYVEATFDAADVDRITRIYVNGNLRGEDSNPSFFTPEMANHTQIVRMAQNFTDTRWLDAKLYAVAIWDHVRTPKEIYDTYHGSNIQESAWL